MKVMNIFTGESLNEDDNMLKRDIVILDVQQYVWRCFFFIEMNGL